MDFDSAVKTINRLFIKKQPIHSIVHGYEDMLLKFIDSLERI
jgi:hypothetical protein